MTRTIGFLGLAALVAACGGEGGAALPDASNPTPAAPAPPVLTSCPMGWREIPPADGNDVPTCDPWPASGEMTCAADEAHFPGELGCARIGIACPIGEWADDLPTGVPILYVRAGGAPGGDGSMAAPYGTIAGALAAATDGTVIALGKGTYDEPLVVTGNVTLQGACVAMTQIASSSPATAVGTVTADGHVILKNLRIGGERPGIYAEAPAALVELHGVVITGARASGIVVANGAHVSGETVVVRDTRSRESDLLTGRGISARQDAVVELARIAVLGNRETGVAAFSGASVTLTDSVVADTLGREADLQQGWGVSASTGASQTLTRVVVLRNHEVGVHTTDEGSAVALTDVLVADSEGRQSDGAFGRGVNVQLGAALTASRVVLRGNREVGLFVSGAGTVADVSDAIIGDTRLQDSDDEHGRGITVQTGAHLTLARVLVRRNLEQGLFASGAGTLLQAGDLIVDDTGSQSSDGWYGRAVNVQEGASLVVQRATLRRNHEMGVFGYGVGTSVWLEDVVVSEILEQGCAATQSCNWENTIGFGSYHEATFVARRFSVSASALCGVQLATGGQMDLQDGEVFGNPIGANVQDAAFDLARLQKNVVWHDNEINYDGTSLPVPEPGTP